MGQLQSNITEKLVRTLGNESCRNPSPSNYCNSLGQISRKDRPANLSSDRLFCVASYDSGRWNSFGSSSCFPPCLLAHLFYYSWWFLFEVFRRLADQQNQLCGIQFELHPTN
jgi:hypothetical protein